MLTTDNNASSTSIKDLVPVASSPALQIVSVEPKSRWQRYVVGWQTQLPNKQSRESISEQVEPN